MNCFGWLLDLKVFITCSWKNMPCVDHIINICQLCNTTFLKETPINVCLMCLQKTCRLYKLVSYPSSQPFRYWITKTTQALPSQETIGKTSKDYSNSENLNFEFFKVVLRPWRLSLIFVQSYLVDNKIKHLNVSKTFMDVISWWKQL